MTVVRNFKYSQEAEKKVQERQRNVVARPHPRDARALHSDPGSLGNHESKSNIYMLFPK